MANDAEFFRYKTTYPDGKEYFSRSYRAKGPATAAMNQSKRYDHNDVKTFNIQKLAAVLHFEEHYSYEGVMIETPVARLEWVDIVG
jgi:hypothetical protein